jgi:Na+(H+)/acetate symporter ActP
MTKFIGVLGVLALILWAMDMIHGPHNGDAHRVVIHTAEFICFFGFLCVLEAWLFRMVIKKFATNSWLAGIYLSLVTCVAALLLSGLAGGSPHGDGGPIASSFLVLASIASLAIPICFIVLVVISILQKRRNKRA